MGMYTEIFMRAELKEDVPEAVLNILRYLLNGDGESLGAIPSHPFFQCDRWLHIGTSDSAYFPFEPNSALRRSTWHPGFEISVHANLKNYDQEIDKFFDWIDPYVRAAEGEFLGYSLYEEGNEPILYFKKKG